MPVPAYNTFNEVFDSLDSDDYDAATPFKIELIKPDDFTIKNWPVQPGDFRVLNATKSIALALLKGVDLDNPALASLYSKISIIGSITTENLGVEHLVKNFISNPFLRHLVLWGEDVEGHLPGDALINLLGNGVDKKKRIIGARGARPVLKNLTQSETRHLRRQIQVFDMIGRKDISELNTSIMHQLALEK